MRLDDHAIEHLSKLAKKAAINAGEYIQSQIGEQYTKKHKDAGSSLASQVVTAVDLQAQQLIMDLLKPSIEEFELGLLTEEAADDQSRLKQDYFWCIDPMDGTLAFSEGRTGYAVSIALLTKSGDPLIGVVYIPDSNDCYTAIKGKGVLLNGYTYILPSHKPDQKMHVYLDDSQRTASNFQTISNQLKKWADSQYGVNTEYHIGNGAVCNAISVMHSGLACYFKFTKVAEGGGSIWDFAATRLFFEELGLYVSNALGQHLHLNDSNSTFMNQQGVLYVTDQELSGFLIKLRD